MWSYLKIQKYLSLLLPQKNSGENDRKVKKKEINDASINMYVCTYATKLNN